MSDARELKAMRALVRAVEGLEPDEERRVLAWFVASRTADKPGLDHDPDAVVAAPVFRPAP